MLMYELTTWIAFSSYILYARSSSLYAKDTVSNGQKRRFRKEKNYFQEETRV